MILFLHESRNDGQEKSIKSFFKEPMTVKFELSDYNRELMSSYVRRFGQTYTGIGRILAKVPSKRIWKTRDSRFTRFYELIKTSR